MLAFGRYGVYDDGGANDDSDAVMSILFVRYLSENNTMTVLLWSPSWPNNNGANIGAILLPMLVQYSQKVPLRDIVPILDTILGHYCVQHWSNITPS